MKLRFYSSIFAFITVLFFSFAANAETAGQILDKAAGKIKAAKGLDISYTAASGGRNISGILKAAGSKFYVKAAGLEAWYNGKALYSYNPSTKETTVVTPSAGELAEINPLFFLNSYNTYFSSDFSKNKQAGKYVIDLKAKSRKSPAKKITVFINSKTLYPEKFTITASDGSVTNLTISKINIVSTLSSSLFEYPQNKYPGVSVVDLR